MRRSKGSKRTYPQILKGGPYDFKKVFMSTAGTLPIKVGEWRGYYNHENKWADL